MSEPIYETVPAEIAGAELWATEISDAQPEDVARRKLADEVQIIHAEHVKITPLTSQGVCYLYCIVAPTSDHVGGA